MDADLDTATRLRLVVGRLSRRLRETVAGADLTPTQISVLAATVRRGPVKLADLGEYEGLNPTMLSRAVGNLEAAGLLTRRRDARDARAVWAVATDDGQRVQREIRAERSRALADHLDALTPSQRDALEGALPALEALVGSLSERSS